MKKQRQKGQEAELGSDVNSWISHPRLDQKQMRHFSARQGAGVAQHGPVLLSAAAARSQHLCSLTQLPTPLLSGAATLRCIWHPSAVKTTRETLAFDLERRVRVFTSCSKLAHRTLPQPVVEEGEKLAEAREALLWTSSAPAPPQVETFRGLPVKRDSFLSHHKKQYGLRQEGRSRPPTER